MRLTIVGCAGSFPGPSSSASCYLLEHEGTAILLDLGNGSLGSLARHINPYEVSAIALSHLHIDHCADVASLYVGRKWHPDGQLPRIQVAGPEGVAQRMADIYDLPADVGMTGEYEFIEFDHSVVEFGPFRITPFPVAHCVPTFGLRVEAGGATLVYSGDTGPCPQLVENSVGADLALYEASYLSRCPNPPDMHLTGRQAAEHANSAGVGRLILTHLVAWYDWQEVLREASDAFDGHVELAKPGMVVEI